MKITDIINADQIRIPLAATDKAAAITELIDLLNDLGKLTDRDDVLSAVLAREATRSTGIGQSLAVPHGKSHGCRELTMAIGVAAQPIEFDAVDGRPCKLLVLLASPIDKTGPHIQALASVSRLWLNEHFRRDVFEADTPQAIYAAIEKHHG